MSIKFHRPKGHGSGFIGYRVTVRVAGEDRHQDFPTNPAKVQDESNPYVRYQLIKAKMQEAEWEMEEALNQFLVFVTEDDPGALPYQGVGCHGILCDFFPSKWGAWQSGFRVRRKAGRATRFVFEKSSFSKAWSDAVTFWASLHGVEEEDVQRILKNPPVPAQFKQLRRHLNDTAKTDIPVEALTPVFAEQRETIARQKALENANRMKLSEGLKAPRQEDIEADMLSWFESESQ